MPFPRLTAALLALSWTCAAATAQAQADYPDSVRANLMSGTAARQIGVSQDGRLVVALEPGQARYFDAFDSTTYSSEDTDTVVDLSCDDPVAVFIGGSPGHYAVQIPCADGTLERFAVTESTDITSASALAPVPGADGATTVIDVGGLTDITAAAADSTALYVVGTDSGVEGYTVSTTQIYSLSLDDTGDETAATYTNFSNTTSIKAMVAREGYGDLAAVSSSGDLFVLKDSYAASQSLIGCNGYEGTSPKQMLLLNDTLAAVIGSESVIYLATFDSSSPLTCDAFDWEVEDPIAIARLTTGGEGSAVDYLYVHGTFDGGDMAVFATPTMPQDNTPLAVLSAAETPETSDVIVASSLARVYLGTSQGVSVLTAGPWLDVTLSDDEPILMTEGETRVTLTVSTDEDVASCFDAGDDEPFTGSACEDNLGTDRPRASTPVQLTDIDVAAYVSPGLNQVFVYGKDADGNLGWTSFRVYYVAKPGKLEVRVIFGDQTLHLYLQKPDNDAIDDVQLLMKEGATEEDARFVLPEDPDTLPEGFDTTSPVIVVDDPYHEYPEGGWPMSLGYIDNGDEGWSEVSATEVGYALYPLNNDTWYCVSLRPMAGTIGGDAWSDVTCDKVQATLGASSVADAPGFCLFSPATCSTSTVPPGQRGGPWGAVLLPAWWAFAQRRRRSSRHGVRPSAGASAGRPRGRRTERGGRYA